MNLYVYSTILFECALMICQVLFNVIFLMKVMYRTVHKQISLIK